MRIRNYFFLAFCITLITASIVYQLKTWPMKGNSSIVVLPSVDNSNPQNSSDIQNIQNVSDASSSNTTESDEHLSYNKIKDTSTTPVFKLNVPYYQQQYANSCEAASLRMALAYYGIKISDDMEIIQQFGYKPRDKDVVNNEWDNPQEMFVGYADVIGSTKGYGVYGKPVMKAAKLYGRDASYETNITPEFLADEIKAGYPIILWGYTSITTPAYNWKLADGGEAKALKGEHARLVIGFSGDVDNPTGFYLHDPFNGNKSQYWTSKSLMDQVSAVPGVTNQAVVVK